MNGREKIKVEISLSSTENLQKCCRFLSRLFKLVFKKILLTFHASQSETSSANGGKYSFGDFVVSFISNLGWGCGATKGAGWSTTGLDSILMSMSGWTGKGRSTGITFGKLICGINDGNGGRVTTASGSTGWGAGGWKGCGNWQYSLSAPFRQQYGGFCAPFEHWIKKWISFIKNDDSSQLTWFFSGVLKLTSGAGLS